MTDLITAAQRPMPLVETLSMHDDDMRDHHCTGYAACLEYAATMSWASWCCEMCPARRSVAVPVAPETLRFDGLDWWWSKCVVFDVHDEKVVAGRHLVCQAIEEGDDTVTIHLVQAPQCPACSPDLWGAVPLLGARGCRDGHEWYSDHGTLMVGYEGAVGRPWKGTTT